MGIFFLKRNSFFLLSVFLCGSTSLWAMEGGAPEDLALQSPQRRKVLDQKDADAFIKEQLSDVRDEIVSLTSSTKDYIEKLKLEGDLNKAGQLYNESDNTGLLLSFSLYRYFILEGLVPPEPGIDYLKTKNIGEMSKYLGTLEKGNPKFSQRREELEKEFYSTIRNLTRALGFRDIITKELELEFHDRADDFWMSTLSVPTRVGIYWRLGKYQKLQKCILDLFDSNKEARRDLNHYFHLALAYSEQENWGKAYEHFMMILHEGGYKNVQKGCFIKKGTRTIKGTDLSYVRSMDNMLKKLPLCPPYFTERIRKQQISLLHEEFPKLHQEREKLEDQKKQRRLRKKAILVDKIIKAKEDFHTFDQEYEQLWCKASSLSAAQGEKLLEEAEALAAQVQAKHQELKSFHEDIETPDEHILICCDELRLLHERFKSIKDRTLLTISKTKREEVRALPFIQPAPTAFSEGNTSHNIKREYREKEPEGKRKEENKGKGIRLPSVKKQEEKLERKTVKGKQEEITISTNRIKSFKNSPTRNIWTSREPGAYSPKVLDLLDSLNKAESMFDLRRLTPPGTKIEKLKKDRAGQVSLRINDQFRICFRWVPVEGAYDIEVVDYH